MQAGWYDDGSGRQRWWDGTRWTDDFAPAAVPSPGAPAAPAAPAAFAAPGAPASGRPSPVLGFVGLGLSVLGTIFACIPGPVWVFAVGALMLLVGFVLSLIGLLRKGAAKWPSIVGMILAVVGGIVGAVVLVASILVSVTGPVIPVAPTETPSTDQSTTVPSDTRMSPDELATGIAETLHAAGNTSYDDMPEFYPCVGQFLYDSELSDETLRLLTSAQDPLPAERDAATKVITDATLTCDPNGEGAWG